MSGGDVAVMSSAGSGNHGIVAVIPVAMTARELGADDRKLAEALALSHLVCGYIKAYTGRLTPTCGCAVAAGAGAAAGIVRLHGGTPRQAELAAITLVGTLLGMICDGAKPSCAGKIAMAVEAGIMGCRMNAEGEKFLCGDGIVGEDADETISNTGRVAREGLAEEEEDELRRDKKGRFEQWKPSRFDAVN